MDRVFRSFETQTASDQPLKIDIGRIEGQRGYHNNKTLVSLYLRNNKYPFNNSMYLIHIHKYICLLRESVFVVII